MTLTIYTDACKKQRHIGLGWVIKQDNETLVTGNEYLRGNFTSMEAESLAIIRGMRSAMEYEAEFITFYTDCLPLVNHISDDNPVSNGQYLRTIERYSEELPEHVFFWISREHNETADREAHVAVDEGMA